MARLQCWLVVAITVCSRGAALAGPVGIENGKVVETVVTGADEIDWQTLINNPPAPQQSTDGAAQGEQDAQANQYFHLGLMYEAGDGLPQNDVEAVRWYHLAALRGNASAQVNLGWMFREGRGVPRNDVEAVKWFRRSAAQGHPSGQVNLGFMYEQGRGVPQDDAAAVKWYPQTLTFSVIGGADQTRFGINSAGVLSFNSPPDYDALSDANGDNVYEVMVAVSDGNGGTSTQTINITVTPVNDHAPVFMSPDTTNVSENTTAVLTVTAMDADLPPQASRSLSRAGPISRSSRSRRAERCRSMRRQILKRRPTPTATTSTASSCRPATAA